MEQAASDFYSRYLGQTWKNIISIGDAVYELDALRELCASRLERRLLLEERLAKAPEASPRPNPAGRLCRERLRAKVIALRPRPTLAALTFNLRLSNLLLEAFVRLDGDFDLDLRKGPDSMRRISEVLGIAQLGAIEFPPKVWDDTTGGGILDQNEDRSSKIEAALEEVSCAVNEAITDDVRPGTPPRPGFSGRARRFTEGALR
jgi:hypothetical protein